MKIIDKANIIRNYVRVHGQYRVLSEKSGVPYQWMCKFARNSIPNPGIKYVSKLEDFFDIK